MDNSPIQTYARLATNDLSTPAPGVVRAVVISNTLHVLATNHDGMTTTHFLVNERAEEIGKLPDLSVAVAEASSWRDGLLVTRTDSDGRTVLIAVNSKGDETWRTVLRAGDEVTLAPRPLFTDERRIVVWEEVANEESVLDVCVVSDTNCDQVRQFPLGGVTLGLDLIARPTGLMIARLSGFPPRCSLMLLDHDWNLSRIEIDEINGGPIALAPTRSGAMLAWTDQRRINLKPFDDRLRPAGDVTSAMLTTPAIERLRGFGGVGPAFLVTTREPGPHSQGLKFRADLWIDGRLIPVPLPTGWVAEGGWLGETLILIHGDHSIAASAFSLSAAEAIERHISPVLYREEQVD